LETNGWLIRWTHITQRRFNSNEFVEGAVMNASERNVVKICQMAFIVEDLSQAMRHYTEVLGAGPWNVFDRVPVRDLMYHGKPAQINLHLAMSYLGDMQIELIQQTDNRPSVYMEVVAMRGYGLHHCGVATRNFDAELARYQALGFECVSSAVTMFETRAAYLDSHRDLPYLIELVELNTALEEAFGEMRRTSITWDGSQPVRPVDLSAWDSSNGS
jgi:4-hydroxyphenylpyruvate dioxygenase-like putative hemolysin